MLQGVDCLLVADSCPINHIKESGKSSTHRMSQECQQQTAAVEEKERGPGGWRGERREEDERRSDREQGGRWRKDKWLYKRTRKRMRRKDVS